MTEKSEAESGVDREGSTARTGTPASSPLNPKQALAEAERRWPNETWSVGKLPRSRCVLLVSNAWSKNSHTAIGRGATWEDALKDVADRMGKI